MENKQFKILILILILVVVGFGVIEWQVLTTKHQVSSPTASRVEEVNLTAHTINGLVKSLEGDVLNVSIIKTKEGHSSVSYSEAKVRIASDTIINTDEFRGATSSTPPMPQRKAFTLQEFRKEAVSGLLVVIDSDEDIYTKNNFTAKSIFFVKTTK